MEESKIIKRLLMFKDLDILFQILDYILKSKGLGFNLQSLTVKYLRLKGYSFTSTDPIFESKFLYPQEFKNSYQRLYRFLNFLAQYGFIELRKLDGLLWIKPRPEIVDLILRLTQNSNQWSTRKTEEGSEVEGEVHVKVRKRKLSKQKLLARSIVRSRKFLRKCDYVDLYYCFLEYLDDTGKRVLVFLTPEGKPVFSRYRHRFRKSELKKAIRKFERVFERASKYGEGVFGTFTMNPKDYNNILDAVKRVSKAWNRFMSYLKKQLGFRPPYVKIMEFQDSGNPHVHFVLFGVKRIMEHRELTEKLKSWGFGEIHFEYQIINKGGSWVWKYRKKGFRPRTRTNDVLNYLKKYLKKSFNVNINVSNNTPVYQLKIEDMKLSLYFATDCRFFTYSRCLSEPVKVKVSFGWVFVGSFYYYDIPDWVFDRYYEFSDLPPPIVEQLANIEYSMI